MLHRLNTAEYMIRWLKEYNIISDMDADGVLERINSMENRLSMCQDAIRDHKDHWKSAKYHFKKII